MRLAERALASRPDRAGVFGRPEHRPH